MGEGQGGGEPMSAETPRALRRRQTDAERKLWSFLRGHQMAGYQFRRQAPIGRYIVDFACFAKKLVIEVDGGQHADNQRDVARTQWLESQGFQVIRFWNNDILANSEGVRRAIEIALGAT